MLEILWKNYPKNKICPVTESPQFQDMIRETFRYIFQFSSKTTTDVAAVSSLTLNRQDPGAVTRRSCVVIGKTLPSRKPSPLQEHKFFGCRFLIWRGMQRKMVITAVYLRVRCMSLTWNPWANLTLTLFYLRSKISYRSAKNPYRCSARL